MRELLENTTIVTPRNAVRARLNRDKAMDYARHHGKVVMESECGDGTVSFSKNGERVPASQLSPTLAKLLRDSL